MIILIMLNLTTIVFAATTTTPATTESTPKGMNKFDFEIYK